MSLSLDLTGRRAVVTGVSQGIGAGIARRLAEAGADVAGCALEPPDHAHAHRFLADVAALGRRGWYFQCDLGESAAPGEFVAQAATALGGIDILVANAARNFFRGLDRCTDADWEACIALNLASTWRLARAAKPYLDRAASPVVVVITSNHADYSIPGCFPYNVAKAGLGAVVQSFALEWGPRIRAVGIAPGYVETEGTRLWFATFPDPAAKKAALERAHPAGCLGTPEDIGALCVYLASEHARFMTGSTVLIDGGHSANMGWDIRPGGR